MHKNVRCILHINFVFSPNNQTHLCSQRISLEVIELFQEESIFLKETTRNEENNNKI